MSHKDGSTFTAQLINNKGEPISNNRLNFCIEGINYTKTTDIEGFAKLSINLPPGIYKVTTTFKNQTNCEVTNKIIISSIIVKNTVIKCNDPITAEFVNFDGYSVNDYNAVIHLNGHYYETKIVNGKSSIQLNLTEGIYNLTIMNPVTQEEKNYTITVFKYIDLEVDIKENYTTITAKLPKNEKGTAIFNVNGKKHYIEFNETDRIQLILNDLDEGDYNVFMIFDSYYSYNKTFTIPSKNKIIITKDFTKTYLDNTPFEAQIIDNNGKSTSNIKVTFCIYGTYYNRITDSNGIARLNLNLPPGTYEITTTCGNNTVKNIITVLERSENNTEEIKNDTEKVEENTSSNNNKSYKILSEDITMEYRDGTAFKVQLTDDNGNPISNTKITHCIKGIYYNRTTDSNGMAKLNINLSPGIYYITTTCGNYSVTNKITITINGEIVNSTDDNNDDNNKYSDNGGGPNKINPSYIGAMHLSERFTVSTFDPSTNQQLQYVELDFYCNGVHYYRTTDFDGVASLGVNLPCGVYPFTITFKDQNRYGNYAFYHNLTVKSFIECEDIVGTVGENTKISAKFLNKYGGSYFKENVIFEFEDKIYEVITDKDGIGYINLDLNPGYYSVNVKHPEMGEIKTINIEVKPAKDYIDLNIKVSGTTAILKATLPNNVNSGDIIFNVNGKQYVVKSIDKVATLELKNLKVDKYNVFASFEYPSYISKNKEFTIGFGRINLIVNDVVSYYGNTKIIAKVYDKAGKPIKNQYVTINIDGNIQNTKTNQEGIAKFNIFSLNIGNHTIKTTFKDEYGKIYETISSILVKSRIKVITDAGMIGENRFEVKILEEDGSVNKNPYGTFEINGNKYNMKTDNEGTAYLDFNLKPGVYPISLTYNFGEGNGNTEIINYTVYSLNLKINIDTYKATIIADIPIGEGNAIFNVDDETYIVPIKNKEAKLYLDDLDDGIHKVSVMLENTNIINSTTFSVDLNRQSSIITSKDIEMFYKSGSKLYIKVNDEAGKPIANEKVYLLINGVTYSRTLDSNGTTSMIINLNAGNYLVKLTYKGSLTYRPSKTSVIVFVKETVAGDDIVKVFRNETNYVASFMDSEGKPLVGVVVDLNINGIMYHRTTNTTGGIKFTINLSPGEYILTATNPSNGEMYSNNITVLSNMISENFTMYYKNGSQYTMTLLDAQGKPVGENVSVELNINGVIYHRKTNSTGGIKFAINLPPGKYIITASYNGLQQSNTITVLSQIEGENIEMSASDRKPFTALILDENGEISVGTKVSININGIIYQRTVFEDKGGVISLNINLPVGEYILTVCYPLNNSNNETLFQSYNVRVKEEI